MLHISPIYVYCYHMQTEIKLSGSNNQNEKVKWCYLRRKILKKIYILSIFFLPNKCVTIVWLLFPVLTYGFFFAMKFNFCL